MNCGGVWRASRSDNAYHKNTPNRRSSTLRIVDELLALALSVFYPAGLISVEEIGRFALEAVRDKWERKGGPNFQNAGMGESREGHSKHAKSFSWGALELTCKLLASFYCGHVSHV